LQIQTAAEWLTEQSYANPDLEIALNLVLQVRIILQETGERVTIMLRATKSFAHRSSTPDEISSDTIRGVMIASPRNDNVSLVGGDRATTEFLFALIQPHDCPRRVVTFSQTED
jgi:hypothetical protein